MPEVEGTLGLIEYKVDPAASYYTKVGLGSTRRSREYNSLISLRSGVKLKLDWVPRGEAVFVAAKYLDLT